jgi:hypothetical protein
LKVEKLKVECSEGKSRSLASLGMTNTGERGFGGDGDGGRPERIPGVYFPCPSGTARSGFKFRE